MNKLMMCACLSITMAAAPRLQAQITYNPTAPALKFNVFANNDVTFDGNSGHAHGPVAMGGDLVLDGSYDVCYSSSGSYPSGVMNNSTAGSYNYGLVVNGRVYYNAGQVSKINGLAQLRIGSLSGTTVLDKDNNGANVAVRAIPSNKTFQNAHNYVTGQNWYQSASSVSSSHGINFSDAFTSMQGYATMIANYPTSQASSTDFNFVTIPTGTGGTQYFNISSGKINYINLTASQFATLQSNGSSTSYAFSPALNTLAASTVVVFNVQNTGNVTWVPLNIGGLNGSDGSQILWNFTTNGTISITGSNVIRGTIFAPNANYTKSGSGDIDGQLIVNNAVLNVGELHYVPFTGMLPNISSSTTPLSTEILKLQASQTNAGVQLRYEIKLSADVKQLKLQRSADGLRFEDVHTIAAPEKTETLRGDYTDLNVNGMVYYRISSENEQGQSKYSNTVVSKLKQGLNVSVAPNPFRDRISIVAQSTEYTWKLVNATGAVISHGDGNVAIDGLGQLPKGFYILYLSQGSETQAIRMIKE